MDPIYPIAQIPAMQINRPQKDNIMQGTAFFSLLCRKPFIIPYKQEMGPEISGSKPIVNAQSGIVSYPRKEIQTPMPINMYQNQVSTVIGTSKIRFQMPSFRKKFIFLIVISTFL